jgi:hypothetical protein
MYGEVAWSGPAPFAVPSVVEDVLPPGWGSVRVRERQHGGGGGDDESGRSPWV